MTQLRSLKIENFRGIRRGQLDDLTDVNILVGKNNCGKTTVIEAMCRVASSEHPPLREAGVRDLFGRTFAQIWSRIRSSRQASTLSFDETEAHSFLMQQYEIPSSSTGDKSWILASIEWSNPSPDHPNWIGLLLPRLVLPTGAALSASSVKNQNLTETRFGRKLVEAAGVLRKQQYLSDDLPQEGRSFFSHAQLFRPQDAFDLPVERLLWPKLLSGRGDKELTAAISDIFGMEIESLSLSDQGLFALFSDRGIPLDVMGDGTRVAFRSWIVLASLSDTLLMMEEPECFQHPGSLERYAAVVCRLAQKRRVQLVISTHSGECVSSFLRAAKSSEAKAAVYHLGLDPEGIQTARRLDPEAVESLRETGVDVRYLDLYA